MNTIPPYYHAHKPHGNRRSRQHDYKAPVSYMITIRKNPAVSAFSALVGRINDPNNPPAVSHSYLGELISVKFDEFLRQYPMFEFSETVIMPDHIHIVWRVKQWLPKKLGWYVANLKSACTWQWKKEYNIPDIMPIQSGVMTTQSDTRTIQSDVQTIQSDIRTTQLDTQGNPSDTSLSLFEANFNDKIAYTDKLYHRFIRYAQDNPRRRLLVTSYPEYFSRRIKLTIDGMHFHAYGNFQLLRHVQISPVVISRRHTAEQRARLEAEWEEIIRSGGVLVSPFISQAERAVMQRGIEGNASIIKLIPNGLPPKYKPSGRDFDLCAEGRLLHLGEYRATDGHFDLRRDYALQLNKIAYWIAERPDECAMCLSGVY